MAAARKAPRVRLIVILTYPEGQSLDVVGPLEVFATANRFLEDPARLAGRRGPNPRPYRIEVVAPEAGPVRMQSGLSLVADHAIRDWRWRAGEVDTLVVAGGNGTEHVYADESVRAWIREGAAVVRRVASVCTGTFLLAGAGLLAGRRVTTHWGSCAQLQALHPELEVAPDPIFVKDGRFHTSAGVTSGMDLALALVEEDHGRDLALEVAQTLVLFLKRPGGQSQFSAQLSHRLPEREALRATQAWIHENPAEDLGVERLAERCAMSPRHFARVFVKEVGETPARFVERARVEAARRHLEESSEGIEGIAQACGFGSAETMRRAFLRTLHVAPSAYRSRFRSTRPGAPARSKSKPKEIQT